MSKEKPEAYYGVRTASWSVQWQCAPSGAQQTKWKIIWASKIQASQVFTRGSTYRDPIPTSRMKFAGSVGVNACACARFSILASCVETVLGDIPAYLLISMLLFPIIIACSRAIFGTTLFYLLILVLSSLFSIVPSVVSRKR